MYCVHKRAQSLFRIYEKVERGGILKNIFALLKKDKEERTLYFSFAKEEIAKKNLEQIKFLSSMVTGLLLLFF